MIATKEITDKKQLLLMKQNVENKLKELGKDWGYIQKTTLLDASTIQRFIDLKSITEEDLHLILKAVDVGKEKEQKPKIPPQEEKSEKTTPKLDYERFKDRILQELQGKDLLTGKDVKDIVGKPMPFWIHYIEKMKKENLIIEEKIPNEGRGPKQIKAYRLPTMADNTEKTENHSKEPQSILPNKRLIEITLSNGETFKIEADEVEFTDPVIIRRKGKIVLAIDPEMFECVSRA